MALPVAARERPNLDRDDFSPFDGVVAAAAAGIGAVLLLLAALGIYPFAGAVAVYLIGGTLVAALHAVAASLAVTVYGEARHDDPGDDWTGLQDAGHVLLGLVGLGLVAGLFLLDRWIVHLGLSAWAVWGYFVSMGVAAVVAAAISRAVLSRTRGPTSQLEDVFLHIVAGMAGLAVGAALVIGLIGVLAYQRQASLPTADIQIAPVQGVTGTLVALGESYSSGEGLPPFKPGTQDIPKGGTGCHRSRSAYSALLTFEPPLPGTQFTACSGAVIQDVYQAFRSAVAPHPTVGPQVQPGVHPDVGLVTLTIAGDDVLFSDVVTACFEFANCLDHDFNPHPASTDHPNLTSPPKQPLRTWGPAEVQQVSQKAGALYTKLRQSFPNARIVAIGYPYLFPAGRAGFRPDDCASILRRFSLVERSGIRDLQDKFNHALYEQAVATGIDFLSPVAVWDGHEPCGSKGQYVNSLKPILQFGNPIDSGSFHPNANGQRELAALVACYLTAYPHAPPAPRPADPPGSKQLPLGCNL